MGILDALGGGGSSLRNIYSSALSGLARQLPIPGLNGAAALTSASQSQLDAEISGLYAVEDNPMHCIQITSGIVVVQGFMENEGVSFSADTEYEALFDDSIIESLAGNFADKLSRVAGIRTVTRDMTSQIWKGGQHINVSVRMLLVAEANATTEIRDKIRDLMTLVMPNEDESGFLTAPGPRLVFNSNANIGSAVDQAKDALTKGLQAAGFGTPDPNKPIDPNSPNSGQAPKSGTAVPIDKPGFQSAINGLGRAISEAVTTENPIAVRIGQFLHFDNVVIKSIRPTWEQVLDGDGLPMIARVDITFETFQMPTTKQLEAMLLSPYSNGPADAAPASAVSALGQGIAARVRGPI